MIIRYFLPKTEEFTQKCLSVFHLSVFLSFCLSVFLSFCLSLYFFISLSLSLYFYLSSLNKHNFCLRLVKVLRQVHDDGSLELGAGDVDHHPPRLRKFLFLQRFFQLEVVDDDLHNFVVEQFSDYNFTYDRTLADLISNKFEVDQIIEEGVLGKLRLGYNSSRTSHLSSTKSFRRNF